MADRPILFSGPMVRALLAGRKTQTRRLMKPQPNMLNGGRPMNNGRGSYSTERGWKRIGFAAGDRLWVREAWRTECNYDDTPPRDLSFDEVQWRYEADGEWSDHDPMTASPGRLRAGMHMPRWASRLTLTVSEVRVQRLQEIGHDDAVAEGVSSDNGPGQIGAYITLWDSLNAKPPKPRAPWDSNPWVVAVSFTVDRRNIDAEPALSPEFMLHGGLV
jgi:hypothetical protein